MNRKRSLLLVLFLIVFPLVLSACGGTLDEKLALECLKDGGKKGPACEYFFALQDQREIEQQLEEAKVKVNEKKDAYEADKKAEEKASKDATATAVALTTTAEALLQPTPTSTPTFLPPTGVVPGSETPTPTTTP